MSDEQIADDERHDDLCERNDGPHWATGWPCGCEERTCIVGWCSEPRLRSAAVCYGHAVDADDPRHLPTHIDGDVSR